MYRVTWLFAGIVIGAVGILGAQSYHFIHTKDGIKVVAKRHASLTDTYLDVRSWGLADWTKHPDLMVALTQNNRQDIFQSSGSLENSVESVWQSFEQPKR